MPHVKVAFRCINCGHFVTAADAGECHCPHACPVCRKGVRFDSDTGVKYAIPDNWEHLCDATPERLAELGLTTDDVEKHEPPAVVDSSAPPQNIERSTNDGLGVIEETKMVRKRK